MTTINVGLLGLGTVGKGVATIVARESPQLASAGLKITRAAVRTITPERQAHFPDIKLTTDAFQIVNDPEIQIIVEAIGGIDLPYALIQQALRNGKHVITANKDLIATHGQALTALAASQHVALNYEAAVMGSIPILRTLNTNFAGDTITSLAGIANGTSNFILSQMARGRSYPDALAEAQQKGFAEADPTNDVEGLDASYKLLILCRLAFGLDATLASIHRQGITTLTAADFAAAKHFGCTIKPLIRAIRRGNQLNLTVAPALVPNTDPLSHVDDEFNAIELTSTNTKSLVLIGPGAGSLPTANAVVADLQAVAHNIRGHQTPTIAAQALQPAEAFEIKTPQLIVLDTDPSITGAAIADHLGLSCVTYQHNNALTLLSPAVTDQTIDTWRATLNSLKHVKVQHVLPVFNADGRAPQTQLQNLTTAAETESQSF
ncbi:homoserine dehydrogenase [Lacticaseibacillus sp. 53-4]|uniref:homoserine dehydrogenase n=1 Tax=Lacticaseibacillus sp. 53-4 TaxID=2799575 RepID=UPI00194452DD|nr:homoserine dehydrogenase [Lacticaseibacillus sp. 53-4]